MLLLKSVLFMMGDKLKTGYPVRLLVYVGGKVYRAEELEETLVVADGPSSESGLLSKHLERSDGVPALGELGCKFL